LQHVDGRVQLITAPEAASSVEHFLGLEVRMHLSQAALEALAIIAYRQPITRSHVEVIRGVGSDSVLRTLLRAGLVERVGRMEGAGRPFLYGTTAEFLQHFGLQSLDELPELEEEG
jgi:segregation and condensation protein B